MIPGALETAKLSWYRTRHRFRHYAELHSAHELPGLLRWAEARGLPVCFLGNGSNTLFARHEIETVIVKNFLPGGIEPLGEGRFSISSSTPVMQVLRYCFRHRLDSFYYLASVPATIGGALAMNAGRGRGHNQSIWDFAQSVTLCENGALRTLPKSAVSPEFRQTIFSGLQERFIVSAVFHFPPALFPEGSNPVLARIAWAKAHQDARFPGCGSVFSQYSPFLLRRLKGRGENDARWSSLTLNWLTNEGQAGGEDLHAMICRAEKLHRLCLRPCRRELVTVF